MSIVARIQGVRGEQRLVYRLAAGDAPMLLQGSDRMLGYWEGPLDVFEWACATAGFDPTTATWEDEHGRRDYDDLLEEYYDAQERIRAEDLEVDFQVAFQKGRIAQAVEDGSGSIALLFTKGTDGLDPTESVRAGVQRELRRLGHAVLEGPYGPVIALGGGAAC